MTPRCPSINAIIDAAEDTFALSRGTLSLSLQRTRVPMVARSVAAHLLHELRGMSQPEIAKALCLRAHSAVGRLLSVAADRLTADEPYLIDGVETGYRQIVAAVRDRAWWLTMDRLPREVSA